MLSFQRIIQMSAIGACLIVVFLIIAQVMGKHLAAKYRRIVWLILAFQLLIPFDFTMPQAPVQIKVSERTSTFLLTPQQQSTFMMNAGTSVKTAGGISLVQVLWAVWLLGVMLMVVYELGRHYYFRQKLLRWSRPAEPEIQEALYKMCTWLKIRTVLPIRRSKDVEGPMIIGLFKPVLLLPYETYSETALNMILCHELMHYKRRDMWIKLVVVMARIIHWFNPLVYLMVRRTDMDLECACDDAVVQSIGKEQNRVYSETILSAASAQWRNTPFLSTHFKSGKKSLKVRIVNIMNTKKSRMGLWIVAGVILAVLASGLLLGFTVNAAPNNSMPNDQVTPTTVSTQGKSDAYKLLARLAEVDTHQSVSAYNAELIRICEAEGISIFAVMADVPVYVDDEDQLYGFYSSTLSYSASELYAEVMPNEKPYFYGGWFEELYYSDDEVEAAYRGSLSDEEWALVWDDIWDDEPLPRAWRLVEYTVTYDIVEPEVLTVAERDNLISKINIKIRAWLDAQSSEGIFAKDFKEKAEAELARICEKYSNEKINFQGEISLEDEY